jgi:hypothetical protein
MWLIYIRCWCKRREHCANEFVISFSSILSVHTTSDSAASIVNDSNQSSAMEVLSLFLIIRTRLRVRSAELLVTASTWRQNSIQWLQVRVWWHFVNVTAVSSNCKLTTATSTTSICINFPYFLFIWLPLLAQWRIYASCLTCTGRLSTLCPAPTVWVTCLMWNLKLFQGRGQTNIFGGAVAPPLLRSPPLGGPGV